MLDYNKARFKLASLALLTLAACSTLPPEASKPALELPTVTTAKSEDLNQWWQRYQDPALNALIEQSLQYNADIKAAVARVDEAAALLSSARSNLTPTADLSISANRSQASEKGAVARPVGTYLSNTFSTGVNLSYEVDLWGRVRANNSAALGQLISNREALNALRSSLAAQVARAYFSLLATDRKLALTQQTLRTREEALALTQKRLDGGTANSLQLQQAQSERDAVAANLPNLIAAQAQSERALQVLAGASPRAIIEAPVKRSQASSLPDAPAVPAGLSSDLLTRRPDIRQAEADLATAQAKVSEARARYYPQLVLTGNVGQESAKLSDLFSGPALIWAVGAALTQPIFGLRDIDAQVDAAKARGVQSEANYVKTVQTAFKEVYDALGTMRAASDTLVLQQQRSKALSESLRIAQRRYDAGVSQYLDVLDAQRSLYAVDSDRIDAQANRLNASVDLFRALGGGW
ncbi:efflux transporter outer membrane subunit [Uliginosibacterium sediminicola]